MCRGSRGCGAAIRRLAAVRLLSGTPAVRDGEERASGTRAVWWTDLLG
jgi:hypothetical protein